MKKSTVDEIRARFDRDVERFSNLETGQAATIDAALAMDLVAEAAAAATPRARRLIDIGCGAGNYSLRLLERLPGLDVTLIDLSGPMLERAEHRVGAATSGVVRTRQGDIRTLALGDASADIVVAAAVLHHLRNDDEWQDVFVRIHRALAPGGSFWIFDLVDSDVPGIRQMLWARYATYLESLKGPTYRDEVFAYIDKEDTPRSLVFQMDRLRGAGFTAIEVLYKNACFAAFGGVKAAW